MQAIITKYRCDNEGTSSVTARAQAGWRRYVWVGGVGVEQNHLRAAEAFANERSWLDNKASLYGGSMPDDTGYAFVIVHDGKGERRV